MLRGGSAVGVPGPGLGAPRNARGGRSRAPMRPGVRGVGGTPGVMGGGKPALGGGERVRRGEGDMGGRSGTIVSGATAGERSRSRSRSRNPPLRELDNADGGNGGVSRLTLPPRSRVLLYEVDGDTGGGGAAMGGGLALAVLLLVRLSDAGVCRGGLATWCPRSVNVGGACAVSFGCSERTSLKRKRKSSP